MSLVFQPIPDSSNPKTMSRWMEEVRRWFNLLNSITSVNDADYTTNGDYRVVVTAIPAPRTITISSDDIKLKNRLSTEFVFKDAAGGATVNPITIATEGSETIDGAATAIINSNYGRVRLFSDGSNLFSTE